MALTCSVDQVDENGREILTYGTEDFPIAFFDDDLTNVTVPTHWHDELEIVLVTKGIVHVRIAGNPLVLTAGEGYFVNSGVLHSEELETKSGHQHALVFSPRIISPSEDLIWQSYVDPVLKNPCLPYIRLSSSIPWQEELLHLTERAWNYGAYDKENYPIQVRYCLSQSFALIAANADMMENELNNFTQYQLDEFRIKKMLRFIQHHYAEKITIDAIAQSAAISVSTCLRVFSTVLETTPINYLIRYRLQMALDELKHSKDRTIAEIAYSCGFTDASYFNRCFRKAYAMTPTECILRYGIEESL